METDEPLPGGLEISCGAAEHPRAIVLPKIED